MNKKIRTPYTTPMCEVLEIGSLEVLCSSRLEMGGTMEGVGNLDDIFGGEN